MLLGSYTPDKAIKPRAINSGVPSHPFRKTLPCCSYSAADTDGLARSSVLVRVDPRPGSANSGSYATIADLEPLYARPCGSRASYYAASHVTHLSQVRTKIIYSKMFFFFPFILFIQNL
ncbi:hypothetical protein M0802_015917 [Mischocyttarus mexicanus]|nr:hypothetical protein M0802_015918 [Mischocyttarus mexicanus]KAI4473851.1 hypothetical protein M0802_015917 [Mischocyttarus mexicanus]